MMLAVTDVVWNAAITGVVAVALAWIAKSGGAKLDKIHTLVNSNMGNQLRLCASVTQQLAEVTPTKANIEAAALALKMLEEHDKNQAKVDRQKP